MAIANDLILLFLGLETLSLAFYVLAASNRRRHGSQEAGIKYFILGGLSSAFFLYGVALVYGATGSTNLSVDLRRVQRHRDRRRPRHARARRHRPAARRLRLQDRRRPVPRLGPRRLPGRADADHVADGVGRQGGRLRRPRARAHGGAAVLPRRLAPGGVGAGAVVARRRVGAGGRAVRREADARLLVDQPRRIHPRRGGGSGAPGRPRRHRSRASRRRSSTSSPTPCS